MLSTKNVPEFLSIPKTLQPGNRMIRINDITLEKGYDEGSLRVILHCEGVDLGDTFEGFLIDKDNPALGRYAGQIGRIKLSQWDFADGEVNGRKIDRDMSILGALKTLAKNLRKQDAIDEIEASTIEQFVELSKNVLVDPEYFNACIAGKEYLNKEGYTNYDLFLPKNTKDGINAENADVPEDKSRLQKFSEALHIKKKKAAATVGGFQPAGATAAVSSEFDLS